MKKTTILAALMVMGFVTNAKAQVCFSNWKEYTEIRDQLPVALRSEGAPLSFGFGNPSQGLAGIVQITRKGSQVGLDSVVRVLGVSEKSATIKKACFSAPTLEVTLSNGKSETIKVSGRNLIVKGQTLAPISARQYAQAKEIFLNGAKRNMASFGGDSGVN